MSAAFRDKDGAPVTGLQVRGSFASPADLYKDEAFAMRESEPGIYVGDAPVKNGVWDFNIVGGRDGATLYQSINRVKLD